MRPRIVCIVLPVHITVVYTGQVGHERDSFLRKDDSCDRTLVIYIYIELDICIYLPPANYWVGRYNGECY